jgi:short-subunit dehydrogenase
VRGSVRQRMALPPPSADSTCLVTGASSGIGAELAQALARRGHGVTLVARRKERLEELAQDVARRHGVRAEVIARGLDDEAGRDGVQSDLEALGLTVEVLCNNAGFGSAAPFVKLDRRRELEMLRLNCEAVVDLCARYAPGMVKRGRGAILNVASTAAFQPLPGQSTYAASKALVLSFSEAIHQELGRKGVAVTALCPGPVKTEFSEVAGITNVEASTPSFLWASAEGVAEAGIQGLETGRRVVVPGALNRVTAITGQHSPRGLFLRAAARFYPVGRE